MSLNALNGGVLHSSSVHDEMWGMEDAIVACRQLGYTAAIGAPIGSFFGTGKRSFSRCCHCQYRYSF